MRIMVCVALLGAACGKGSGSENKAAAKPFEGPLTVEKVLAAKDVVKPLQPWDSALATLQSKVGPPTKIDGNKHAWAAMEGDNCAYFYVEKGDAKQTGTKGDAVYVVSTPEIYTKDGAMMNRAECLTLVGKGVPPESPNAAGPRADGAAYQVTELLDQAFEGRSKWKGQQVRVVGRVTQMMGDEALVYDLLDDNRKVNCKLDAGATAPELGKRVVLQGTVGMREFVRGTGEPGMEAELTKCTVVALDCKGRVAEMHGWFDLLEKGKAPKPWPFADERANEAIKKHLAEVNDAVKKDRPLTSTKKPDISLTLLAACKPALDRYKEIRKDPSADRVTLLQSVGDKFAECDCAGDIDQWQGRMYAAIYAASGAWVDKPLTY